MNETEFENYGGEPDEFERQLKNVLRRTDPPAGFAGRVMQRAVPLEKRWIAGWRLSFRHQARAWAFATVTLLMVGGLFANQVRLRRERERVARIQAQFETAMRVTNDALNDTRADLEDAGVNFSN